MLKKLLLLVSWYPLAIALLVLNLSLLRSPRSGGKPESNWVEPLPLQTWITAPGEEPGSGKVLGTAVIAGDARVPLVSNFLTAHKSPMMPYADVIVSEADKQGIDFRLLVSIAMCESNLGKRIPSSDSFNAWGISVYTGQQHGAKFRDWPHAIAWVSRFIREKFHDNGITDLKNMGAIWAPPSVEKGYSWSNCVESFLTSIE